MSFLRWSYYKKNIKSHIDNYHNPGQYKCEEEGCGKVFNWKVYSSVANGKASKLKNFKYVKQASLKSHEARHKLPSSQEEKPKKIATPKSRKIRCDRGQPKKAIAAILSGHPVSKEESKKIMRSLD